jgi:hypothetical protein
MKLDYGIDLQPGHALQPRITACGERYHPMVPFGGLSFKWKVRRSSRGLAHSCANYTDEMRYWKFSSLSTGLSHRSRAQTEFIVRFCFLCSLTVILIFFSFCIMIIRMFFRNGVSFPIYRDLIICIYQQMHIKRIKLQFICI